MIFLKNYWPYLLVALFLLYRVYKGQQMRKRALYAKSNSDQYTFIDVRSNQEYLSGHAQNSINIPLQDIAEKASALDPSKQYGLVCQSGTRSSMATRILKSKGFQKVENLGTWSNLI